MDEMDSEESRPGVSSAARLYDEGGVVCDDADETGELSFEDASAGEAVGVRGDEGLRTSEGGSMNPKGKGDCCE